ncbi:MAG: DNA cytosine methyltransferase [Candidatus Brockarchaeota archaeon]|nr:DNA cytosine methyltransferase [Candidatus Brockarchaeota archaeon]
MIPVVDLFAGPGGLGEGFSTFRDIQGQRFFRIALAIEKDEAAHATLLVRSFFRQFNDGCVPDDYYRFVRNEISLDELFRAFPAEATKALEVAWKAELGKVDESEVDKRISKAIGDAKYWVLIGGPPCQPYSLIGRARIMGESQRKFGNKMKMYEEDSRHFLYEEYLRIIGKHAPPVFVMENVKGLLSARVGGNLIIRKILRDLEQLGYKLHPFVDYGIQRRLFDYFVDGQDLRDFVICCEKHGIPQCRHRVILLGLRRDIHCQPRLLNIVKDRVSLSRVIGDLPKLRSQLSREKDSPEAWAAAIRKLVGDIDSIKNPKIQAAIRNAAKRLGKYHDTGSSFVATAAKPMYMPDWFSDIRLGGVPNHETRFHMASDLRRYFFAACFAKIMKRSPFLFDFPKSLLPAHENINRGENKDIYFRDRFRVQLKNKPSTTITAHIAKDGHYFIHPDPCQCRSLTVREAARLQTFPDNYVFLGVRTEQYRQVGNAVPPLLARQLAAVVYQVLKDACLQIDSSDGSNHKGKEKLEHVPYPLEKHRT